MWSQIKQQDKMKKLIDRRTEYFIQLTNIKKKIE